MFFYCFCNRRFGCKQIGLPFLYSPALATEPPEANGSKNWFRRRVVCLPSADGTYIGVFTVCCLFKYLFVGAAVFAHVVRHSNNNRNKTEKK